MKRGERLGMISLYWLITLFSGSFFLLYWIQNKRRITHFTQFQLLLFYFGSRAIFLTQLQMTNGIVFNYFIDLLILYGLKEWFNRMFDQEHCFTAIAVYLANPFVLTGIVSGNPLRLLFLVGCGVVFLVVAKVRKFQLTQKVGKKLLNAYVGFSVGGFLFCLARDIQRITYKNFDYSDGVSPTVYVLGGLLIVVCLGNMLFLIGRKSMLSEEAIETKDARLMKSEHVRQKKKEDTMLTKETVVEETFSTTEILSHTQTGYEMFEKGEEILQEASLRKFTKWDWLWLTVLTVFCAV